MDDHKPKGIARDNDYVVNLAPIIRVYKSEQSVLLFLALRGAKGIMAFAQEATLPSTLSSVQTKRK